MGRIYVFHDFEFSRDYGSERCLAAEAVQAMTEVDEFGGFHALGTDRVLVTTGFYNPEQAIPIYWCRVIFYEEEPRVTRICWAPITSAEPSGTIPAIPSGKIGNELTCNEEELTWCLMHILFKCARLRLNSEVAANVGDWYAESELRPTIELENPLFDGNRPNSYVWTRAAAARYKEWEGRSSSPPGTNS